MKNEKCLEMKIFFALTISKCINFRRRRLSVINVLFKR